MIIEHPILFKYLNSSRTFKTKLLPPWPFSYVVGFGSSLICNNFVCAIPYLFFYRFVVYKFQYHCVEKIYHNVHTHHGSSGMFKFNFVLQISRNGLSFMCIFWKYYIYVMHFVLMLSGKYNNQLGLFCVVTRFRWNRPWYQNPRRGWCFRR